MSEVTLDQYQQWERLEKTESVFLLQKAVQIFCDIPLSVVNEMNNKQLRKITDALSVILEKTDYPLIKTFELGGTEYGFEPDFENLSTGAFLDLSSIDLLKDCKRAATILYRPITRKSGDQYLVESYENGKTSDLSAMPVNIYLGAVFFLLDTLRILEADLHRYLKEDKQVNQLLKTSSVPGGDGIIRSTPQLGVTLLNSIRLQHSMWKHFLRSSSTKKREVKSKS